MRTSNEHAMPYKCSNNNKNRGLKGLLKLTIIYVTLAFITVFVACSIANSSIVMDSSPAYAIPSQKASVAEVSEPGNPTVATGMQQSSAPAAFLSGIRDGATDISFSYDGSDCIYIDNGKLVVINIKNNNTVRKIGPSVTNAVMMNNQKIIIYITVDKYTASLSSLKINTYNIQSDIITLQKLITIPTGTTIFKLSYSADTSTVFFDARSKGSEKDTIYYLNIMKTVHKQQLGFAVRDIVLLNNAVKFYYTDSNDILYTKLSAVGSLNNSKVKILGVDSEDNLYMQSLDDKNIFVMDTSNQIKTISLLEPNFKESYCDANGVYLVYNNYAINIASNPNTKMDFDNNLSFIGIGGDNIFFRNTNGNIVSMHKTI